MKRNSLTTAVLAGLTGVAGMAGVANAVNVNPDGLGQVLLFPYYTTRGDNHTMVSIVNTTNRGKAVKIRFIEALNSREVLDFNIYMSPFDVWVAAVTEQDGVPGIWIPDATCTVPYLQGGVLDADGRPVPVFQEFLDFEFTTVPGAARADGGPTGIERAASGYIEVIEMGTLLGPEIVARAAGAPRVTDIAWAVKHNASGVPNNCAALVDAWTSIPAGGAPAGRPFVGLWIGDGNFGFDLTEAAPRGGLFGSASIINPAQGFQVSYNATAIDGFFGAVGESLHTRPDSLLPSLASGDRDESNVFLGGRVITDTWAGNSLFALNAVLMQDQIFNEYLIDKALEAHTEWVVTFPTKRFHVDAATQVAVTPNNPIRPFTRTWHRTTATPPVLHLPCDDFEFLNPVVMGDDASGWLSLTGSRFWDREEQPGPGTVGLQPPVVSPVRPGAAADRFEFQLCREANVIRIAQTEAPGATEIFAEPSRAGTFSALGFTNIQLDTDHGWIRFDLANIPAASPTFSAAEPQRRTVGSDQGRAFLGLPVIGFGASTILNTNAQDGVLANYGSSFNHRGSRAFVSVAPGS